LPAPSPSPLSSLQRLSLVEQTARALRQALAAGTLADPLPGENTLARQLGVSRPTLRAALATLSQEGRLHRAQGRRTRLAGTPPPPPPHAPTVCFLFPCLRRDILPDTHPVLLQLQQLFAAKGIRWDEINDPKLAGARPENRLARLTAARPGACWLLLASTAPIQRWFSQQPLPAMVLGTCHDGVALPSIDLDYRAVGWHAAGLMLQAGHRRLAVIQPEHPLAGDLACHAGFIAYCQNAHPEAAVTTLSVARNAAALRAALSRMLAPPSRPTALFTLWQPHSLTTLLHLLAGGRRIPADISLVARDLHPFMRQAWPDLAHYDRPMALLVGRALRLTQAMLTGRQPAVRFNPVTPRFLPGRTLGPAPA
jgi:DNA-binding LacI/PurR family transcriptional regulator